MARPNPIRARFFQRASDDAWLARVDTQSPLSAAEAEMHCAAEYGFPVRAVEVTLPVADYDTLAAQRKVGAVFPPPQPPSAAQLAETARVKAVDDATAAVVEEINKAFTARLTTLSDAEKAGMKAKVLDLLAKAQGR